MLTLWLTAVLVTVLHLPGHSSAATSPSARRPLPTLDGLSREHILPFSEDLTAEMGHSAELLPNDAFFDIADPYLNSLHGAAHGRGILQDGTPGLGALLRQRKLHSEDTYRRVFPSEDSRQQGGVRGRDAQMDEETRLVLLYSLLPRASSKRARRGGWRPRGRRGKALRAWAALGGKRQAVLDRMPLSYGRKRSARSAERDSEDNSQPQATEN